MGVDWAEYVLQPEQLRLQPRPTFVPSYDLLLMALMKNPGFRIRNERP